MDEEAYYLEDMTPGDDGEVSAVTEGANPGAHILLLKNRDSRLPHRDTLPGNSPEGERKSSMASKDQPKSSGGPQEVLLKLDPSQKQELVDAAIHGARQAIEAEKAEDDPPKGQPGEMTGGRARDRIRQLQSNGMSLEEISAQLERMGESASRSPSVLGAILSGEIMNPPDDLLGFLRRVKPTEEDREEASMSKDQMALEAEIKELKKQNGELEEENARMREDNEKAAARKAFAEVLPPAMQEAFMAMTPEEQEAFKAQFEAQGQDKSEGIPAPMAKMFKSFEDQAKENQELAAKVEKMKDEQDQTAAVQKFQDLSHVVKVDDFARSYRKLHKAAPEEADAWVEKIRALAAQEKTGKLLSIIGGDGDGQGETARQKIQKKVKAITDADPKIPRHKAQDMVFKAEPELYDQYKAERSA